VSFAPGGDALARRLPAIDVRCIDFNKNIAGLIDPMRDGSKVPT
jgi:hypothetical protein